MAFHIRALRFKVWRLLLLRRLTISPRVAPARRPFPVLMQLFDRTHRFALAFLWNVRPPNFAFNSAVGRAFLLNWQLSGIVVAMSGLPVDIVDTGAGSFYGLSNGSTALVRPQWTVGGTTTALSLNIPTGYFFNPAVFQRPIVLAGRIPSSRGAATADATGTDIGNVGRNVLRGPRQSNFDFAIIKRFKINEVRNVEFRTECFNVFNHVNFANPISDLNSIPAGGMMGKRGRSFQDHSEESSRRAIIPVLSNSLSS